MGTMASETQLTMVIFNACYYGDGATGYTREYEWEAQIVDLGCGAGRIRCPGCDSEPIDEEDRDNHNLACVECKDTGFVLVSI